MSQENCTYCIIPSVRNTNWGTTLHSNYGLTSIQLLLTIPLFSTGPLPFFISPCNPCLPVIPFPSFIPPFIRTAAAGFSSSLRSNLSSLGPNCKFYPWTRHGCSKRWNNKKIRAMEWITVFYLFSYNKKDQLLCLNKKSFPTLSKIIQILA